MIISMVHLGNRGKSIIKSWLIQLLTGGCLEGVLANVGAVQLGPNKVVARGALVNPSGGGVVGIMVVMVMMLMLITIMMTFEQSSPVPHPRPAPSCQRLLAGWPPLPWPIWK